MVVKQERGILNYACTTCRTLTSLKYPAIIHAGLSNVGFMYCNFCGKVITWSSFDKHYESIVGQKHPWTLSESEQKKVENSVINCECGGHFSFFAKPRCPTCKTEVPLDSKDIHYYNFDGLIDGEKINIWKK